MADDFFSTRGPGLDSADLNSTFSGRLQQAILASEQATGVPASFTSLARTTEKQAQLYQDYLAGKIGLAAPPGHSLHEQGLAADLRAGPNLDWLHQHANEFGLEFLPGHGGAVDPGHIQIAGGTGAPEANGSAHVASTGDNPLLTALIHYESGGQNIANTTQSTSSGPARGFLQITDGTWNEFGGDKTGYATAQDAPFNVQLAIGSKIPLSRWDPKTLNYLRQQGIDFDPSKTLGENIASTGGGSVNLASLRLSPNAGPMGMSGFLPQYNLNSPGGWAGLMGQALAQGVSGGGGTPQIEDPQDQPAIRTPALSTQLTEGSPSASPPSSGLGMTLASLTDTGLQPLDTSGGINAGAPSMGSFSPENVGNALPMTGVGSLNPLSSYPATRYSRLS